jgi:hypothetical protein
MALRPISPRSTLKRAASSRPGTLTRLPRLLSSFVSTCTCTLFPYPPDWTDPICLAQPTDTGLTLPSPLSTLLAVPIPDEFQAEGLEIQKAVEQAVVESLTAGIVGKEMTPWLLARVGQLTQGRATKSSTSRIGVPFVVERVLTTRLHPSPLVSTDLALIENNAHVGSKIAVELAELKKEQRLKDMETMQVSPNQRQTIAYPARADLVVSFLGRPSMVERP